MFRHPHYLEVPWDIRGHPVTTRPHRHLWWLIALLILLAMFLIGVGVTQGIFWGNRINVLDQWRQARALPQSRRSGPDTGR